MRRRASVVTVVFLAGVGCAKTGSLAREDAAAVAQPDVVATGLDVTWPDAGDRCGLDAGDCRAVAQIHVGSGFSCVRRAGGGVDCWGANGNHWLGNGETSGDRATPGAVVGLGDVTLLAPWTCGLRASGEWWCWGTDPFHGRFGIVPEHRAWMAGMVEVSSILAHVCARRADGAVLCWGPNGFGQVGDRTSGNTRTDAAVVAGLTDVVRVTAGYTHTCALRRGGEIVCWGSNFYGELGDGTIVQRLDPTPVDWLRGTPVDVGAGYNFTCALRDDGTVVCWGANVGNVLGEGLDVRSRAFPLPVAGVTGVSALRVANSHACALRTTGTVVCWGLVPGRAQVFPPTVEMPAEVEGLSDVVEVAVADDHDCARTRGGAVWCWGDNRYGQLGDGTMTERRAPVEVTGLRP